MTFCPRGIVKVTRNVQARHFYSEKQIITSHVTEETYKDYWCSVMLKRSSDILGQPQQLPSSSAGRTRWGILCTQCCSVLCSDCIKNRKCADFSIHWKDSGLTSVPSDFSFWEIAAQHDEYVCTTCEKAGCHHTRNSTQCKTSPCSATQIAATFRAVRKDSRFHVWNRSVEWVALRWVFHTWDVAVILD